MVLAALGAVGRTGQIVNLILTILLGSTFLVVNKLGAPRSSTTICAGPHFDARPASSKLAYSFRSIIMTGTAAPRSSARADAGMLVFAWKRRFTPDARTDEVSGPTGISSISSGFSFSRCYAARLHGGPGA
jgi:hypothetical protein